MAIRPIAVLVLVLAVLLPGLSRAADDYQTAQQLYQKGQPAEAIARLDAHLASQPRDARARFLKGVILSETSRRAEAIEVFTLLTQDFPELPEPYNNLAVLYAGRGDYDRAREALLMAIRNYPEYTNAHENLGDVYAALARQQYARAIELDRKNQTAPKKLTLLRELLPPAPPAAKAAEPPVAAMAQPGEPRLEVLSPPSAPAVEAPPPEVKLDVAPESPVLGLPSTGTDGGAAGAAASPSPAAPAGTVQQRIEAVLRTVDGWAQAWSQRDASAYLAFYGPGFRPPKGEPRAKWESARRADFAKLRNVTVKVLDPQVTFGADELHASVAFAQEYASATQKVNGRKTLDLVRDGERWLIEKETFVRR